ncbi:hypothetical protein YPPY13_3232 [Yersinia pestis PY-13]|uniref:Uncharacterized protein n=1 Tax=Yersinia pestis PY-08 TaxID=992134 RepID=A0AB72ZMR5_YERPE|nr:hypothetical protein YPPY01_3154 [Yersinia pestis PY-01]EIR00145.1 hypothetical protein YPPY04_3211 [Yersinia pestis PY-04]EIR15376.1 hypothetical protein YPPY07_3111 [Yersinia pestis PY-07]EIR16227.1 hypothetical protein YPPY08_3232 [Yersinia pestis PY-08]EIR18337.1 hypothetical protein YPPY09_3256 [Yersinia pestis PY-09]EIR44460.1 hypothetical protein YPPY13_3232 [Yersinia pestis PY-13]EIR63111.1 hypothetical protein YPPY25_3234 [Yersinia pestis PY-25]EIR74616.1 hypothetical protein YPP
MHQNPIIFWQKAKICFPTEFQTDQSTNQQESCWCHGLQDWSNYLNEEKLHYEEDDQS